MTQDKTLREQFYHFLRSKDYYIPGDIADMTGRLNRRSDINLDDIADFYEDKIKSVVREIQIDENKIPRGMGGYYDRLSRAKDYNKFGDDLLERLGIK